MTLKEALKKLNEKTGIENIICKVIDDVDISDFTCTCEPLNGTAPFFKVRLKAENPGGNLIVPKKGSTVIVSMLDNGNGCVSMFSEVEYFLFTADNSSLKIEKNKITMNDGSLGGLVKIETLTTKLNNLETKVNDVIAKLKAVVIPLAPSGTYPLSTDFASVSDLTKTKKSDIENTKIKHG